MKKLFSAFLSVLLVALLPVSAAAESLYNSEISVKSEILYLKSVDDGTVIFDKNATMRCAPAALLNIATAMVVLNHVSDINATQFTVPENINAVLAGTNSATMLFKGGEQIRVVDLLHCILMRSAADASVTLAVGVAVQVEFYAVRGRAVVVVVHLTFGGQRPLFGAVRTGYVVACAVCFLRTRGRGDERRADARGERESNKFFHSNILYAPAPRFLQLLHHFCAVIF